jgi:hypothetical protein
MADATTKVASVRTTHEVPLPIIVLTLSRRFIARTGPKSSVGDLRSSLEMVLTIGAGKKHRLARPEHPRCVDAFS